MKCSFLFQSGISNHRTALWDQVRQSFRKNAGETDPDKVCCTPMARFLPVLGDRLVCLAGTEVLMLAACRFRSTRTRECSAHTHDAYCSAHCRMRAPCFTSFEALTVVQSDSRPVQLHVP